MKIIQGIIAVSLCTMPIQAMAECTIWTVEDSSSSRQDRERVFAYTDTEDRDIAIAQAARTALVRANQNGLDFVDVFLTREQDGKNRNMHSSMSALVWMRYNPGSTPLIDTEMEAQVVDEIEGLTFDNGALLASSGGWVSKVDIDQEQIETALNDAPEDASRACVK